MNPDYQTEIFAGYIPLALQNPYPIIISVYPADPIEATLSTFWQT